MILTCPNCDSRFKVKPEALGDKGRVVKCAKCAHKWHAMPEGAEAPAPAKPAPAPKAPPPPSAAEPAPAPQPAPEPAPPAPLPPMEDVAPPPPPPEIEDIKQEMTPPPIPPEEDFVPRRRQRAQEPKEKKGKGMLIAWIVLFLLVVGGVIGAVVAKEMVIKQFPASVAAYNMVGLGPKPPGYGLSLPNPAASKEIRGDDQVLIIKGSVQNTLTEATQVPLLKGTLTDSQQNAIHVWIFEASDVEILPEETINYVTEVVNPPLGAQGLVVTFATEQEASGVKDGKEMMDGDEAMMKKGEGG